ncbi:MAG: hypothetical protein JXR49_12340 [Acidobacteria bacterium]|nr:hypothetical protein [Acidobacteriota bacterium]
MPIENVFQEGPYLSAAFLCERVLEEKDGVKSAMRIVDRIISQVHGKEAPEKMPKLNAPLSLFLSLKTGKKPGKHEIKIGFTRPDGSNAPEQIFRINLEPPDGKGTDMILNLNLGLEQEGTYWFSVYVDELLLTKIPLTLVYLTQSAVKNQDQEVVQ